MKKKINYTDEPKDGLELPESGYAVISRSSVAKKWKELAFSGPDYDRLQKDEKIQLVPARGGSREGAGRKRTGHVRLQLCISPDTRKKIEAIAKLKNISLSQAVEHIAGKI